ncbi:DUF7264 domain-containing protein [Rhodococcus opacus]|uniref:LtfC/p132/Gp6 beta-sandwich domain-containing protein n=1 Tax=Rhodococcus opacus TaxID=37919 RepID=A0A2S8JAU3_RHOOP|nr:hypothetical protein [Rhodococcus opacus]PQP24176.1 hypothetical protein C5613_14950 [Rhodococcus opacus]
MSTNQIGLTPTECKLVLATGGDFQWTFRYDGGNYPAGSSLYFIVGEDQWDFTISGDTATIKIESAVADLVPTQTRFRLIFKETTTPTTETVIAYGTVTRVGR